MTRKHWRSGPAWNAKFRAPHAIDATMSILAHWLISTQAMRLKSQDRDYQLKRDEEREKKAQLRARQDLDQLSVKEFAAGDLSLIHI